MATSACLIALLLLVLVNSAHGFTVLHSAQGRLGVSLRETGKERRMYLQSRPDSESTLNPLKPDDSSPYLATSNVTLSFAPYNKLVDLYYGEYVASEPFLVSSPSGSFKFRVKLYPRGGGHDSSLKSPLTGKQKSGFGMSYKNLPMFGQRDEKVGAYLEYIPTNSTVQSVDVSFGLTLVGQQNQGPRFNVEWRSGMRFAPIESSSLATGVANDFGASFMRTSLLQGFMGLEDNGRDTPLQMNVDVIVHGVQTESTSLSEIKQEGPGFIPKDIRQVDGKPQEHSELVRVGRIVVPVLTELRQRPRMFNQGAYPGVEYRIMRIVDPETNQELFESQPGVDYFLKPIYPLVQQLERPWPAQVNEADIPKLMTPSMYNFISAVGSLATAVTGLTLAFVISQAASFFVIPSLSMDPTLQKGDVVLVDKVTPRLLPGYATKPGNIVFFHPPPALSEVVTRNGGRLSERDLFVKRIAAGPGDTVSVEGDGNLRVNGQPIEYRRDLCEAEPLGLIQQYIKANTELQVGNEQVVVLGDCSSVSIDSRVWGALDRSDIVGRPLIRLWPLDRFGELSRPPLLEVPEKL